MKLLLHTCCAPCLIYPYEFLKKQDYEVQGFFYNPNIQPLSEYKNRKKAVEDYAKSVGIIVHYEEKYQPEDFFRLVANNEKAPKRCHFCWQFRLKKTAELAKEKGFDCFSTTLLVSPYQDIEKIKEIGEEISKNTGIRFIFGDFRSGFRDAHKKAKDLDIFCQKYCGCIFSEIERHERI
ncbi:MAG: epoxyqueuosine reductase QueH [Candidatus Omnitrophica bacterium]|nr:epoxyqueuosine reductase QueH [Candidatus Omnitrophota bacterium]